MLDLLLLYRKSPTSGGSIIGLGVNAYHTTKVLKQLKYNVDAKAVWLLQDVIEVLTNNPTKICVIEAPWLSTSETMKLVTQFSQIHFYIRCHSNVGFLQIEAGAIDILRELFLYSETIHNLTVSSNSENFCTFINRVYHAECTYLPNLYFMDRVANKRWISFHSSVLKVGSFGAIRLQKNHITGAAAALLLARDLGVQLEFYLTVNRVEGPGANGVLQAIKNLFVNLTWAKLVVIDWATWPIFRRALSDMHLCFHLSVTETFSLSTADALAELVPVVGSEIIDWLPNNWKVTNLDNPIEAATIGRNLLTDHTVPAVASRTLHHICKKNAIVWQGIL